ncbi:MAG TPA: metallophosphoesterase family protein [Methylomirabilota bacterium]|nr:metallophosphoesterase family protein [Methylomirabilota bacterium]
MRYAVISDIHSNLEALQAVIAEIPSGTPILCLGDIVGYGAQPNEVIETIQSLRPVVTLMGNHDYAVVTGDVGGFSTNAASAIIWTRERVNAESMRFLSELHPEAKLELDNTSVALYHASPWNPLFEYIYPNLNGEEVESLIDESKSRVVLLGHTHIPMRFSAKGNMLANPGSVGQPRDGNPNASIGFLTLSTEKCDFEHKRVKYEVGLAANKIRQAGLPLFLATRLHEGM